MRYLLFTFFLIALSVLQIFSQENFSAKVTSVISGDTLTVIKDEKEMTFQIAGIDAPEPEQEFGWQARKSLSDFLLNQTVKITNLKKDCLDRLSASVNFSNVDLSLAIVQTGNGWADTVCEKMKIWSKHRTKLEKTI